MIDKKGFTLIELIIVIAVIAILATTVILVLNPAQILAEARDSQRIADLGQMNTAMSLYLANVSPVDLDGSAVCGSDWWASVTAVVAANQPFATPATAEASQTHSGTPRGVDGTGWVPVDFTDISSGAPVANLPFDPTNSATNPLTTTGLFYAYQCSGSTYELNANMESTRFSNTGGSDVESTDGGNTATVYEAGNDSGLNL